RDWGLVIRDSEKHAARCGVCHLPADTPTCRKPSRWRRLPQPNHQSRITNHQSRLLMPHLLLVEDETAIADTVLYALRAEGHEVVHCGTAGEALRVAADHDFDLAILDVGLPDLGGFALCRELR